MTSLNRLGRRAFTRGGILIAAATALAAAGCSTTVTPTAQAVKARVADGDHADMTAHAPAVAQTQALAPVPAVQGAYTPGKMPIAMIPVAQRTLEQWMEYLGVRLVEERDPSGPAVLSPKAGDLYFVTNESTTWGATNTSNNFAFIDAKTYKTAAQSKLPEEYSTNFASHCVAVSSDGKWIYLPAQGEKNYLLVIDGRTFKIRKVYQSLGRPHHVNNFTAPDGRELMMVVDFNWSWSGSGMYVLDPARDNAVVGGMNRADFSGGPYVASGEVNGKYMYVTVPAPSSALREKMEGYLAKVNIQTWQVEAAVPLGDPIWPEVTQDGKTAWVTLGGHSKVARVDLDKMKVVEELSTGPGPWGARLSYDETKLYIADKGEAAGYSQMGKTMTIVDTDNNVVTNVLQIGTTTDHIILSPDGKEVWATSNADHSIVVVNTETEEIVQTIPMPNNGDSHGSTFVRYLDDGKGGLTGEVVSSFSGLRGSALKLQRESLKGHRPHMVAVTAPRPSFGRVGTFSPTALTVEPGHEMKIIFSNAGGTGGGPVTFESPELGIPKTTLKPGARKTFDLVSPAKVGEYKVAIPGDAKGKPFALSVLAEEKVTGAAASAVREIKIATKKMDFVQKEIKLKAGERVRFVFENGDDEKHNIVSGDIGLLSPAVDGGRTTGFEWTVPNKPGSHKATCSWHPAATTTLVIS